MTGNSTTASPAPWPLPSSYTPTQEVNKQVENRVRKEQHKKIFELAAILSQIHCPVDQRWYFQNSILFEYCRSVFIPCLEDKRVGNFKNLMSFFTLFLYHTPLLQLIFFMKFNTTWKFMAIYTRTQCSKNEKENSTTTN